MGSWGPENLSNDGAADILYEHSHSLVSELVELAGSSLAAEFDEYDHDKLFVNMELFFAMNRSGLLRCYPESKQIAELKAVYLERWDSYTNKNGTEWPERRSVIERSFDRILWICENEERRVAALPQWVPVVPPKISEISDLEFDAHLIFDDIEISIPTTWKTGHENHGILPAGALLNSFFKASSNQLRIGTYQFSVDRRFISTGPSPASNDSTGEFSPYIILAEVTRIGPESRLDSYTLSAECEKSLRPLYQDQGEHVSGALCLDALEGFDFNGLEAFRHLKKGPDWGTRLMHRYLYFGQVEDEGRRFLVLEFGSVRDNVAIDFPDEVLINHIQQSLQRLSRD